MAVNLVKLPPPEVKLPLPDLSSKLEWERNPAVCWPRVISFLPPDGWEFPIT